MTDRGLTEYRMQFDYAAFTARMDFSVDDWLMAGMTLVILIRKFVTKTDILYNTSRLTIYDKGKSVTGCEYIARGLTRKEQNILLDLKPESI